MRELLAWAPLRRCDSRRYCKARPLLRHCEARSAAAIHAFARWPMVHHGRWIASFLAMTGLGCNDAGEVRRPSPVGHCKARPLLRRCDSRRHCKARPLLRHCEARSAAAIHAFVRWPMVHHGRWIASFLAMTQLECNDAGEVRRPSPVGHCKARPLLRHCEARSAVAIHAFARRPLWPCWRHQRPRRNSVASRLLNGCSCTPSPRCLALACRWAISS